MIRAVITFTVYAFSRAGQSGLPGVESTQHVLCNKCSLGRSQCACTIYYVEKIANK